MRILIDTCVFIHLAIDREQLSDDVLAVLTDYDNTICVSAETPRELVIQYNNKKLVSKYWKNAREMIDSIENDYFIHILPLKEEHMKTYADLVLNVGQDHKDPSDHVIIAHAITEKIPLISDDGKFAFYRKQGLDFIQNKK
ncbi:MAG: type II toxin-antitoxin system VapC family toxin [Prevotella sp.]|nr:type II toxin-antitoxin system VapC family toxin [Prevotella sp.]